VRIEDAISDLLAAPHLSLRMGRVVSTASSGQVVITVSGATVTVPRLASYTSPVNGDVVAVAASRNSWLVLGKVAT
jgi:hypothetical protein